MISGFMTILSLLIQKILDGDLVV